MVLEKIMIPIVVCGLQITWREYKVIIHTKIKRIMASQLFIVPQIKILNCIISVDPIIIKS
jgi:hypothetical protein